MGMGADYLLRWARDWGDAGRSYGSMAREVEEDRSGWPELEQGLRRGCQLELEIAL